jgi:RimJ/RimL family protein N-acetyltransferase
MQLREHRLESGHVLLIREAAPEDASATLAYVEAISGESDFLSFGPGDFELTEPEEADILRQSRDADNRLYLLGLLDDTIVSALTFSAGRRPRIRHSGELGLSVRRQYWGLGIGSLMVDTLLEWAKTGRIVRKINLRVRTDNQRAIRLYKRKGFVIEGTIRRDVCVDGRFFATHLMGLAL